MTTDNEIKNNNSHFLAYIVPPITSIIYYLTEEKTHHVKFHSIQSFIFGIIFLVLFIFTKPFFILVSLFIKPIVALIAFYFYIKLVWSSHNSKSYELPFIGYFIKKYLKNKNN